ncbi:phosphate ABC transporter substrate-binding protein PstS [Mycobacterium intracellulare]|uniref:Phosphate-binding protein n=1 Tax=Mycobacterium intracellulare subsp. chimaera TaxID=222805 RepID=A0ABT7PAU8_MYCIT|nr:phosphate ABC transporter substrate-binding protein PstS [Mycobacterium intracellulare]AOS91623.1 phosphate ABC transporter substrate-binding protein PstS [Mycobacterium intracellulare subsp. chimaera]ARV81693.1 phosphate ABC transporter substrate-binding protein PstS [Mycobacterium intracellulare subsp. chimaera]ASQ85707.1 phosphate ABC transporter substrate-binding protein PstS [Mycobacterium intracellulare subsp. chimaera]ETZ36781.1 phosphate ABC transporter, phosphate-binding protein Pst
MRFNRTGALSLLMASALVLSGCTGNTNTSAGSSVKVDCGGKEEISGAGAAVQQNAVQRFVYVYSHACPGHALDYEANGSGAGVEQFIKDDTDLAGSGVPLDPSTGEPNKAAARCGSPAWELPAVFQPIALTYRISGVSSLKLDAPTMAKVFNGTITRWDDPAIKALNAGASLPSMAIQVIFRSDQSGSSANFQQYLDAASDGAWGKGHSQTFQGGVGSGAAGDEGVTATLQTTDGSVTYTGWSFALGKQLNMAQIITSASPDPVSITAESAGKTVAGARITGQGNDLVLDTSSFYKPTQPGAYPIVEPTYEIVCSKYPDSATGTAVRAFMQTVIGPGQDGLAQYGSIPPPDWLQSRLVTAVNAIS